MWNPVQSLQLFYNSKTIARHKSYFTKLDQGISAVGQPQISKSIKSPKGFPHRDCSLYPFGRTWSGSLRLNHVEAQGSQLLPKLEVRRQGQGAHNHIPPPG